LETQAQNSVGKTIAGCMLVGLGVGGLAMSLCGGFFTVMTVVGFVQGKQGREEEAWSSLFLVTGSVSLVLGLGAIALVAVVWQRTFKNR
jgi:hypothetical protein